MMIEGWNALQANAPDIHSSATAARFLIKSQLSWFPGVLINQSGSIIGEENLTVKYLRLETSSCERDSDCETRATRDARRACTRARASALSFPLACRVCTLRSGKLMPPHCCGFSTRDAFSICLARPSLYFTDILETAVRAKSLRGEICVVKFREKNKWTVSV